MFRAVLMLFFVGSSLAHASANGRPPQELDWRLRAAKAVEEHMHDHNVPGITVSIAQGNHKRWSRGFGLSDIENRVSAKPETMYQLASVSKSITAVAALQLYEDGYLDLNAPIQQYCPQFPPKETPITTWQLLLHTSGIRHYLETEHNNPIYYPDIVSTFPLFQDDPLISRPGEKFSYTSYGYNVLGCVIEGASGLSFVDYVEKNIFLPARMKNARRDSDRAIIPNRAQGYERQDDGTLLVAGIYDTSITIPGGGLMSTADDMVAFGEGLFSKTLLSDQTLQMAFKGYIDVPEANASVGPGWAVATYNDRKEFFCTGSNPKVSTILYMQPEEELVIAIMGNVTEENLRPLAQLLSDIILGLD